MGRRFITIIVACLLSTMLLTGCSHGLDNNNGDTNGTQDTVSPVVSISVNCDYGNIAKGKATTAAPWEAQEVLLR